jgi:PAS domain S-box-containing protein
MQSSLKNKTGRAPVKHIPTAGFEKTNAAAILQSIGHGLIVVLDAGGECRILYANAAFETMVGRKASEVLDKAIDDVLPREDKHGEPVPYKGRVMTKVLDGRKVVANVSRPFYFTRRDKTKFPVASIVSPLSVNGEIIGAVETFRDITKESAADKAKTEFASLVSHQLRTPFSTINWCVELLLSGDAGKLNPKQTEYLQEVYRASKRMVDLDNVLLSATRIEIGASPDRTKQVDIVALAEMILKEYQRESKDKNLKVQTAYGKHIPSLQLDPKQLTIVFQNLLSNAIKYTPAGGAIKLSIYCKHHEILVTITDTGIGIPKAAQSKIFNSFFRAGNAKVREAQGVGLGLYILKIIVDKLGGRIWFESQENKGTAFYMSLPTAALSPDHIKQDEVYDYTDTRG